ncbi:UDP-N-acetylmuramoyl-tripeptide--D-alanyl-D-alanine ligase [Dysgonomonas sp. 216]|uniref:UDP-N-acetylmuramoyl-tripeptide--D-alanyl-D- alanine ligase n=1 Tax=Dysgonomonas sp. 216 TaxID=2302934 RepID=UPI0013D211C2|nr:UDP-N-acetylmuramoyl-tripeptide--D-alanyl-D-alanine ligase [Dysgonomonas sp. 216]NDW18301.1 UDP-N-acetylmuramoyl-tripeptide--D-alanyl-D-alanine ligase [Dysgonomonas sp. 216]NDW18669.1 UDP-N-acetylmuramoyl-tripeptide--D-alanyl-D-alanine ligase [Dysgonomonas sp. 216]
MDVAQLYEIYKKHPIVTTDTRSNTNDSIFFALKGANFNGNKYAAKAIELGCKYAIVDEAEYADEPNNILLVDDVLKTLQDLANYHRRKLKTPIIGITGTNGKTTTKELLASVLKKEYNVLYTQGNLNNHIGVPLTLLQLKKEHEIAVIEMGASHLGEIMFLCNIAEPDYGLITNIGKAHLEGFGSFENIQKTKGELYEFIRSRKDGKIFIDNNNEFLNHIAEGITTISYGTDENLFVSGRTVANDPYLTFEWRFSKNPHIVKTHLIGGYNLSNALAAVTIGKYFGVKSELVCKAIEEYEPTNNRSQLTKTDKNYLIIDAYNANPTSMIASLSNFAEMNVNNKVLILGDMRELGSESIEEHQRIADFIVTKNFNKAFLIGENFNKVKISENSNVSVYKTLDDFKDYLKKNVLENSYILIKGSRGLELEKSVDLL